jgi:hypothetical protein
VLIVKVRETGHGPPFLRPALFLDGATGEGLRFGVGARLTFLDSGKELRRRRRSRLRLRSKRGVPGRISIRVYEDAFGYRALLAGKASRAIRRDQHCLPCGHQEQSSGADGRERPEISGSPGSIAIHWCPGVLPPMRPSSATPNR